MFLLRICIMAIRGLQTNLLRSLLATLGVIIGVSAVVSAMSILEGANRDVLKRFESMGADQIMVVNGTGRRQARHSLVLSLEPEDAEALEGCSLVKAVAPEVQAAAQIKYFQKNRNVTFTATTSLQVYAQPFISKGTFSNLRALSSTPRAASYDDRYEPFVPGPTLVALPQGFNYQAFQSNVVFRWEYRPGSTLFLVWNEGRSGWVGEEGDAGFFGDLRDLYRLHPMNTFLVKVSYWLNP